MVYSHFIFDSTTAQDTNAPTFPLAQNPYVSRFKILSCHIPLTFRTTDTHNNQIAIRENGGDVRFVTIPVGDYTAASMPGVLKSVLGGTYDVVYDEVQRNLKITNPNVNFSILGLASGTTAFRILGKGRDNDSTAANSWQWTAISNFSGAHSLLLVCNELLTKDVTYVNNQTINCIGMVELNSPNGSYMHWRNAGSYLDMGTNLSYCKFRFLDPSTLREVDFRGAGFQIQMAILSDDDDQVAIT